MDPREHLGGAYVPPVKTGLDYNARVKLTNHKHPNLCKPGNLKSISYSALIGARAKTGVLSSKLKPRQCNEVSIQLELFLFKGNDIELNNKIYDLFLKVKDLKSAVSAIRTSKVLIQKNYPKHVATWDAWFKRLTQLLNTRLSILTDSLENTIDPYYLVSGDYLAHKLENIDHKVYDNIEHILVGLIYPVDPKYFGAGEIGIGIANPCVVVDNADILRCSTAKELSELDIVGIRSLLPYCIGSVTTGKSKHAIEIYTTDGVHGCTLLIVDNCSVKTDLKLKQDALKANYL